MWVHKKLLFLSISLFKNGMYKYFKHPNYFVYTAEIFFVCVIFRIISAMKVGATLVMCERMNFIYCENKAYKMKIKI